MINFSSVNSQAYLLSPLLSPQIPQAQPQPTQSIFIPRQKSKKIISYCPANASISEYDLSSSMTKPFQYTSTCMLPDGNVLIVGGYGPIHGDTYKLNPATSDCIKLKGLNYPRCEVHLYCDDKNVYALGGYNSCDLNKAEKMEWRHNGWETLPDMIHPRNYFGTYYRDMKLYCIGGRDTSSIEYYDFISNTFKLLHNVSVARGANIVGEVDNRIYMLNKHAITFSRSFMKKGEKEDINSSNFLNLSDVIVQGKEVLFYCIGSNRVYSYNVASTELKEVIAIK